MVDWRSEKSAAVQMIQHGVARFVSLAKKKPVPPPPPPTAVSAKADMTLNLPNNVTEYTNLEAVIQLRKTMAKSAERAQIMKKK